MLRAVLLTTVLIGCVAEEMPESPEGMQTVQRADLRDLTCTRLPDRILIQGRFDVELEDSGVFAVEQLSTVHLRDVQTTYACGNWREMNAGQGCERIAGMPEEQSISFSRELQIATSQQPYVIEIEVQARAAKAVAIGRVACVK